MTSKISSFIDSLEYSIQKKKKNGLKFNEIKEKREENLVLYNKNLEFLKDYMSDDCKELPGIIFCVEEVMNAYSHLANFGNIVCKERDYETRKKWLEECTPDKGKIYYDVKNRLLNGSRLIKLHKEKEELILEIEKFLHKKLTESQLKELEEIGISLENYATTKTKSKKIKESHVATIKTITKLNMETDLHLHLYLSILYNVPLCIDCLTTQTSEQIVFTEYIDALSRTIENEEREQRYVKNIMTRTEEKMFEIISMLRVQSHQYSKQKGMYFKKWSLLTDIEKRERIDSWIKWYIYKTFMLGKLISTAEELESLINKLQTTLSIKIPYRYIKWNVKAGIITSINGITYSSSDGTFSFVGNDTSTMNTDNLTTEMDTVSIATKSENCDRIKHDQSFLNKKSNEKIVNDILLNGILKEKPFKECIEKIKIKLGISKISSKEKDILLKKYNDIKTIIESNLIN